MGCANSKPPADPAPPSETPAGGNDDKYDPASGLPKSKVPPTADEAMNDARHSQVRESRLSVRYQAKEMSSGRVSSRRSSAPFDRSRIGTHTRHGIMPGPRGFSAAKINQDRGVVCWPFNGSYNQALLCIFDGHGSKGEKASEFCMTTVPELLEADTDLLMKDVPAALHKNIVLTDEKLLGGELGAIAMNCGTTSTVAYMRDNELWVACSGDSRAVKGANVGGRVVATDLSHDHKPDGPGEQERILKAGGTVSPPGPNGRPARVWANGRVGLAMSRSIGDGLCKKYGVIPDPEVLHFALDMPAKKADGSVDPAAKDHDSFVIVASDGVWEFITSQEACDLVAQHESATDACTALVHEAAACWKRFEGSYRDDITAIVAYLPFLEEDWDQGGADDDDEAEKDTETMDTKKPHELHVTDEGVAEDDSHIYVNQGAAGISRISDGDLSPDLKGKKGGDGKEGDEGVKDGENFAQRRLSVSVVFDDDWNEVGEGDGK